MLTITVPASEYYNQAEDKFYSLSKPQTIVLEHSLVSIQYGNRFGISRFYQKIKKH